MNESLLRDLHETQIEELNKLKAAIKELAEKPAATAEDVAKIQMMLGNIKLPTQDFSELKQYFYDTIMTTTSYTKTQLTEMENILKLGNSNHTNGYKSINNRLDELARLQSDQKPKVNIHKFDFSSGRVFFATLGLIVLSIGLCIYLYNVKVENYRLSVNDLKYRYIKMVGNIDDRLVYDLEELIYKDKSGKVLKEMKKQVEDYERAIELKIKAEEQARLKTEESAKLDKQIKELQGK